VQWGPNNEQLSYWRTDAFKEAKEWLPQVLVVMLGTNDSKYSHWYVSVLCAAIDQHPWSIYSTATQSEALRGPRPCRIGVSVVGFFLFWDAGEVAQGCLSFALPVFL
jgi:hypothetical protein